MQVLNIFHVLIAITLVAFILIQQGQGATVGAAFGSGASGTVFGARGASNFLSRTTWVLAVLFCSISLIMAVMVSRTSALPENDLGVVGGNQTQSQLAPVIESDVGVGDASAAGVLSGADDSAESDMPFMDTGAISDTVDLPALGAEINENSVTNETQVVADGSGGDEPDKDGF